MADSLLITGGAGYIGGHVALALHNAGYPLIILDDLSTGHRAGILPAAKFYAGDIGDQQLLNTIFTAHSITAVFHLAAVASVPESIADPTKCDRINRQSAAVLINAARRHAVPYFIFSSTSAVYDENGTPPFAEDSPLRPLSPYAETKLATEQYLAAAAQPSFAILRYFNVGGADENRRAGNHKAKDTTLIKSALECAAGKRKSLHIYGTDYPTPDGTGIRDYIHVSDIAKAHVLALNYLLAENNSDIFNLGLGRGFSVREIVTAVKKVTHVDFPTVDKPRRQGDPAVIYSNPQKAARHLNFAPCFPALEKIIADAWAWECRNH